LKTLPRRKILQHDRSLASDSRVPLMNPSPSISRILLYVRAPQRIADFYALHFGFSQKPPVHDDLIEIVAAPGNFSLLLHQASKGHRAGQSGIKIVFDVDDIEGFKAAAAKKGLKFGITYKGEGYEFANARDPAKNPIQISRRAFLN
jgi:predicted enzyme related to lactoylglutathione lyase